MIPSLTGAQFQAVILSNITKQVNPHYRVNDADQISGYALALGVGTIDSLRLTNRNDLFCADNDFIA